MVVLELTVLVAGVYHYCAAKVYDLSTSRRGKSVDQGLKEAASPGMLSADKDGHMYNKDLQHWVAETKSILASTFKMVCVYRLPKGKVVGKLPAQHSTVIGITTHKASQL